MAQHSAKCIICCCLQVTAEMLKRQEREVGRNRHWRSNFKQLQRQLIQLEEDEVVLDSVFPQVGGLEAGAGSSARCSSVRQCSRR